MKLKEWIDLNKGIFLERDLRFLVKSVFDDLSFIINESVVINEDTLSRLEAVRKMYSDGVPMPYILGKEEFFGWEFKVNPDVLIPRKETELIVEKAIDIAGGKGLRYILDIGCGCGNIAISIKKALGEKVTVVSSDISPKALMTARANAVSQNVDIELVNTDLFNGFKKQSFDMVVSNPPYVERSSIKGPIACEPRIALEAGEDGMFFIEKILKQAHEYLKKEGYIVLEMGYNHKEAVIRLVQGIPEYDIVEWIRDYSGHWRGIAIRRK